jgi:hypothetical protein
MRCSEFVPNPIEPSHRHRDLCLNQCRVELNGPGDYLAHHPRRAQDTAQLFRHGRLELSRRQARQAGGPRMLLVYRGGARSDGARPL